MLPTGHAIGRYHIMSLLGAGGMGEVYLADDARHRRKVALKVLRPELAYSLGSERFLREIEIVSRLRHPHILPLFDSGDVDGSLFFVMPLVEGESLRARLDREKQLPLDDALRITQEVADALSYAHAHGVVHRDIKPENILIESGHAVVSDFGIALATSAANAERLTGTGMSLGTPTYMSPEQAAGDPDTDGRSDQYSLACVLFEMLAGEPPFTGPTPQSIVHQHLASEPRSIAHLRPAVPTSMGAAIARALAKTPADRFGAVAQFAEALTRAETAPTSIVPPAREGKWLAAMLALVLLLGIAWLTIRGRGRTVSLTTAAPLGQKYVVAVLPFENLSADSARRYFAAGITEEIASQLSRLSALRVLGRSALTPYANAADRIPRMVKDLGVGSVVEGTVRVEGNRARVGVRLIDGRSSQTIWTEQYDRELADVFGVQRDIAQRITTALQASLTPAEARRAGRPPTVDLGAYELYMRAGELNRFNVTQNLASIETLHQAVARDSNFAAAYAELARRFMFLGYSRGQAYFDSGLVVARKAIAADAELPEAHFALGGIQSVRGRLAAARTSYRKALELDPSFAGAMMDLSILEDYLGHYDESLYWAMRAVPLDPAGPVTYYHVSVPLVRLGDDPASERFLLRAIRRFPDNVRLETSLSMLDLQRQRDASALHRARDIVAHNPDNQEGQAYLAEIAVVTRAPDAEALVKPLADAAPDTRPAFLYETFGSLYGWTLAARGERARADSMWDAALARDRKDLADRNEIFDRSVEIAAISAVRGDISTALEWLERAYQHGFKDSRVLARDPFFDGIRSHPKYQRIAASMQEDVAAMHQRAVAAHDTLFTGR